MGPPFLASPPDMPLLTHPQMGLERHFSNPIKLTIKINHLKYIPCQLNTQIHLKGKYSTLQPQEAHAHYIMQSISPRAPTPLQSSNIFKEGVSFRTQNKCLAVKVYKNQTKN